MPALQLALFTIGRGPNVPSQRQCLLSSTSAAPLAELATNCRIADGCGYPRRAIVRSVLDMLSQLPGTSAVNLPVVLFVIDEQQETLAMCALALLGMGLITITAGTVEEGFERACLTHPDVIVINDTYRALRGLTRQLREDARTREASLVVLPRPEPGSNRDADGIFDRIVAQSCAPDVLAFEILEELRARRRRAQ